MLTSTGLALDGAGTLELGAGKRRLGGQHDRFGRGPGLQAMPCTGDGSTPLTDIQVCNLALLLG